MKYEFIKIHSMLSSEVAVSREVLSFSIVDVYGRVRAVCFRLQCRSVSGFSPFIYKPVCPSGDHMTLLARKA